MTPPLDQLRALHAPEAISWWPPAPGWWGLLAIILLIIISLLAFKNYRSRTQWRREAMAEWHTIKMFQDDPQRQHEIISRLSILLRRVAITRFPQQDVAALTGDDWLRFLDQPMGIQVPFQQGAGALLITAPYQQDPKIDSKALLMLCKDWLKKVKGHNND